MNSQIDLPVFILGYDGKMGAAIRAAAADGRGVTIFGGLGVSSLYDAQGNASAITSDDLMRAIAGSKLILDFSNPAGTDRLLSILSHPSILAKAVLIGTTGLSDSTLLLAQKLGQKHKIMIAPNTSLGVLVMRRVLGLLTELTKEMGFDIELVETHHGAKADAPSGTAKLLASEILSKRSGLSEQTHRTGKRSATEVGMHSIRGGGVFGEHEVRFLGQHEELTLSHRAFGRGLFAEGAIRLGRWLFHQPVGCYSPADFE